MIDFGPSYGLWLFAFINSAVFILFAFSFFKPQTSRDWRSFGAFSAFVVALFAEMYGFPLSIFFLSGWLQSNWPGVDWYEHDSGHLPEMILGWRSNPHFGVFHLFSFALIGGGFWLISVAWHHLWTAQRQGRLALTGPYARIPASAICWIRTHHGWFSLTMADFAHARHVPRACLDVCAPRSERGGR